MSPPQMALDVVNEEVCWKLKAETMVGLFGVGEEGPVGEPRTLPCQRDNSKLEFWHFGCCIRLVSAPPRHHEASAHCSRVATGKGDCPRSSIPAPSGRTSAGLSICLPFR